jgi:hypothetical protein
LCFCFWWQVENPFWKVRFEKCSVRKLFSRTFKNVFSIVCQIKSCFHNFLKVVENCFGRKKCFGHLFLWVETCQVPKTG